MKSIKAYLEANSKKIATNSTQTLQTFVSNNVENSSKIDTNDLNQIFIIDAMNLFIRNFSISTILDKRGNHIGGLVGSLNSIYSIIRKFRPKKIIVVFEGDNSTVRRKKMYKEYKAHRKGKGVTNKAVFFNDDEAEESFNWQLLTFIQYLQKLPVNLLSVAEYEADDVIGWLVTKSSLIRKKHCKQIQYYSEYNDNKFTIVSTDNDYLQLVSENVKLYSPIKKIMYECDTIFKEFGFHSCNFLLYKTLIGDKSDNIFGVKGLQLKTLLKTFPIIVENRQICLQNLIEYCETKVLEKKPYKIYQEILNSQDSIQLNEQLMNLSNILIPKIVVKEIEENLSENLELNLVECVYNTMKHCMDEHLFKAPQEFFSEFLYLKS